MAKITVLLEMIKFKLTIFAMPFAFTGAFLAAGGMPEFSVFCWVVVAMVGARTAAMGFNRIVDWKYDAENPRTENRAIPTGAIKIGEAWGLVVMSSGLFFIACYMLNSLTLYLSPFALGLTFFYSLTKRFTSLCHLVLGVALAFSPLGGWVAVTGNLTEYPFVLSIGVLFWVAGFDTVYACLDAEFDRKAGLYSLPSLLGRKGAFKLAVFFPRSGISFFQYHRNQDRFELFLFYWSGCYCCGFILSTFDCQSKRFISHSGILFFDERDD